MNDFICDPNGLKTEIDFFGISKTIEILNKQLEQYIEEKEYNHTEDITRIVLLIIELNKNLDGESKTMRGFLNVKKKDD